MNYSESLHFLDSFINYESAAVQSPNREWNLERMRFLLELFDHPEKSILPILIAGTKGKGSTGFFLQSILRSAGIPAGFYSSPHLKTPRERIRINGKIISEKNWAQNLLLIRRRLESTRFPKKLGRLTYFEVLTMLAILYFSKSGAKIGVFEVGMGGRLDATNVLNAPIAILTNIGLDHEAILGNSLSKIAKEKIEIVRPGALLITPPQQKEAIDVIKNYAQKKKVRLKMIKPLAPTRVALPGNFQRFNAALAVEAAKRLTQEHAFDISDEAVKNGLKAVDWPGRLQVVKQRPRVILDAAHNPAACKALVQSLKEMGLCSEDLILIFGTSRDKKSDRMLVELSRIFKTVILTKAKNSRAQDLSRLIREAQNYFDVVIPVPDIQEALKLARASASVSSSIVVTGSFYVIGECYAGN